MAKFKFYDVRDLLKAHPDAYYYLVIGERSNGKTYSSLDYAIETYVHTGKQFAYVRRFGEDIRKKQLSSLFNGHIDNGRIEKLTGGIWNSIDYVIGKFYFTRLDEEGKVEERSEDPFGYAFDLNSMEHTKSISFPRITTIIFDEFLSRGSYLPNEFILFTNLISTIVRQRIDVKILMLGNTVNRYAPYFGEMGLTHVKEQKQGTIDVYKYAGNDKLEVVVEYCASSAKRGGKESDVYFAFDNPQLQMITTGAWEIAVYPHLPTKYKPKDVAAQFFVAFDKDLLHGVVISPPDGYPFVFLHEKTTPIQSETNDIVYGQVPDHRGNHLIGFRANKDKLSSFVNRALAENRVFYSTNEVGEIFRNYVIWCDNLSLRNK